MGERPRVTWRDRYGDEITCVRCLQVKDSTEMDRLLWCEECRSAARLRATRKGWVVGVVAALALAGWIWVTIGPSDLVIGGWAATVVAAGWIMARVGREFFYGADRTVNQRAAEAVPPTLAPPDDDDPPPARRPSPGGR